MAKRLMPSSCAAARSLTSRLTQTRCDPTLAFNSCSKLALAVTGCSNLALALAVTGCSKLALAVTGCSNLALALAVTGCSKLVLAVISCSNLALAVLVLVMLAGKTRFGEGHLFPSRDVDEQSLVGVGGGFAVKGGLAKRRPSAQ